MRFVLVTHGCPVVSTATLALGAFSKRERLPLLGAMLVMLSSRRHHRRVYRAEVRCRRQGEKEKERVAPSGCTRSNSRAGQ